MEVTALRDSTIITWGDSDFADWQPLEKETFGAVRDRYLQRQKKFLHKCMEHLYQHNQTWTALWDTDEFIVYSHYNRTKTSPEYSHTKKATSPANLKQPGTVMQYINEIDATACIGLNRAYVDSNETI